MKLLILRERRRPRGYGVRIERLELDRVGAGPRRGVHQLDRAFEVAVVVNTRFGDHEDRFAVADEPAADSERAHDDASSTGG